jgi:hypothetical protein
MAINRLYSSTLEKVLQVGGYKETASICPTTGVNSDSPVLTLAEEGSRDSLQAVFHHL